MVSRQSFITLLTFVAVIAGIEWLRTPSTVAAAVALLAAGVAVVTSGRARDMWCLASTALAAGAAVSALVTSVTLARIQDDWPAVRESLIVRASDRLSEALDDLVVDARGLGDRAAQERGRGRIRAFRTLESLSRDADFEAGVVLFDRTGAAWAWGGRHREIPEPIGPPEDVRFLPLYTVLEARQETADGWTVAQVLLDADTVVAQTARSLSSEFRQQTGFGLRFYDSQIAPTSPNIVDFGVDDGRSRDLMSVELLPPSQGVAYEAARLDGGRRLAAALAIVLIALAAIGPSGKWRMGTLVLVVWAGARAPIGDYSGLVEQFSAVNFSRPTLAALSSSAGILAVLGAALCIAAAGLWRVHRQRPVWAWPVTLVLVVVAPYVLRDLGRGISLSGGEISVSLWLTWQFTLALAMAAILYIAAALVRPTELPTRTPWRVHAGIVWAIGAAVIGLWLWEPTGTWPEWYEFIWLPAALLVIGPAPRRSIVVAVAIVAGTGATLITWEATVRERMLLAETDVEYLKAGEDADGYAILERAAAAVEAGFTIERSADLYRLWREAARGREEYPARLWVIDSVGALQAELPLSDLGDFRLSTVRSTIIGRELPPEPEIIPQPRGPGAYYLLVAQLSDGNILAIGLGPRSVVSGGVLGPLLRGAPRIEAGYTLDVRVAVASEGTSSDRLGWAREGWHVHGDIIIPTQSVARGPWGRLHAEVALGTPISLLVRGALMVLANIIVLGGLWIVGLTLTGELVLGVRQSIQQMVRSYRARLTLALAAFFILPAVGFSVWSIGRLGNESVVARDLIIRQTLRDAWEAGNLLTVLDEPDPAAASRQLEDVARRVEAELFLYKDSELFTGSAPILADLGLVEPYLPFATFQSLILNDGIESAEEVDVGGRLSRMGYRRVTTDPLVATFAAVRLFDAPGLQGSQRDLAFLLLLGTLAGLAASAWLAGLAAQQLARPVDALRQAAVAVGRGEHPHLPTDAPAEFRAVMDAFSNMANDVKRSQEMLEAARRRTARVLENVATGVIAVDKHLVVAMANPKAAQIIGETLEPGSPLEGTVAKWEPLWESVRQFLEPGEHREDMGVPEELEIDGRRIRMQLARLRGGAVVALDDTTELAEAERVLAWGEMARQIAHEIKNPLTPLRLGLQHLERVYEQEPNEFGPVFADTSARLQAEIARLDAIARAFSRFGAPQTRADTEPLEDVPLDECVEEVAALYQLGDDSVTYELEGSGAGTVRAQRDEVKEVLVNLIENARNADATKVTIVLGRSQVQVRDNGKGIPGSILPRIFEPRFSTTTSGAGLGLAIVRRLVEGWGARIDVASAQTFGTTFTVRWSPGQ